ncbi:hypothetical protein EV132_13825 [Rhizobium sullae]|uniref:Uncharacterized protein n=1 Tax=Rhizobium sullae TaxID=50338 RepID=A0A4R3PVR7_RHISU|nr:hypothetical protein EV132_13825 [Rhizobium sullae]
MLRSPQRLRRKLWQWWALTFAAERSACSTVHRCAQLIDAQIRLVRPELGLLEERRWPFYGRCMSCSEPPMIAPEQVDTIEASVLQRRGDQGCTFQSQGCASALSGPEHHDGCEGGQPRVCPSDRSVCALLLRGRLRPYRGSDGRRGKGRILRRIGGYGLSMGYGSQYWRSAGVVGDLRSPATSRRFRYSCSELRARG